MKIRTDFVTNSSSSSFVVELNLELADGTSVSVNSGLMDDEDNNFGPSFTIKNSKGRTIKKGDSGIGSVYLEPNEMPKSVLHNFYFNVSAINLGKICSESSVKSLISAIAEPLDLSEHITDVEYNDDDEETIEIIDGFQNKFNTAVDDFNSALTKHITKVSDVKKASVSMQLSGYGGIDAAPADILLNKVFEKNETNEILNVISNTSENKILEELRKLTYLQQFTDKSLENIVIIAKKCDFINDGAIIQTLQSDGKIDLKLGPNIESHSDIMEFRCVSISVNTNKNQSINLNFLSDVNGELEDVNLPLKTDVNSFISDITECDSVETLKKMLINEFDLSHILCNYKFDKNYASEMTTEEYLNEIKDNVYDEKLYCEFLSKFEKLKECVQSISDIADIHSIVFNEHRYSEKNWALDGFYEFVYDVFEDEDIDFESHKEIENILKDSFTDKEITDIIDKIDDGSISIFEGTIETTVTLSDGAVSKKYKFNKLA